MYRTVTAIFLTLFIIVIIYTVTKTKEQFDNSKEQDSIINLFQKLLKRDPSDTEYVTISRGLADNSLTLKTVRKQIMDSDEYEQLVSLQSNSTAPQLHKAISKSQTMGVIAKLYKESLNQPIPQQLVTPLTDIYTLLNYNKTSFKQILTSSSFNYFQQDIMSTDRLTRDKLITLYKKYYGNISINDTVIIGQAGVFEDEPKSDEPKSQVPTLPTPPTLGVERDGEPNVVINFYNSGSDLSGSNYFPKPSLIGSSTASTASTASNASNATNASNPFTNNSPASKTANGTSTTNQTPLGSELQQTCEVTPLLENSKLLLGTPISQADNTQVGSIMPKFTFTQYA